jgi:hypothetical protein
MDGTTAETKCADDVAGDGYRTLSDHGGGIFSVKDFKNIH